MIYHIFNRGVEKRIIFKEDADFIQFIHYLFYLNDQNPKINLWNLKRSFGEKGEKIDFLIMRLLEEQKKRPRKLLVEILVFCLRPNHFHLVLRQKVDGGISKFMQKLCTAYAMYFNLKYKRVGPLFQGKFKAVLVEKDTHFLYLPAYVHANALDSEFPEWRGGSVRNIKKAMKFLENYRWSSYLDYIGIKNFPSVTQRDFLKENMKGHRREIRNWISGRMPEKKFNKIIHKFDVF